LLPGEVLYIPRGFFHCAETDDCASLHLTVGLANQRRLDAVRDIFSTVIQKLADGPDTFWRDSLSVGQFEADEDLLNEKLDEVVDLVRQYWSPARTAEKFARSRAADHLGLFDGKNSADNISANTTLVMAPWINPLIQPAGNKIEVFYAGRKLVLPEAALPAVKQIIEARTVKPSELSSLSAKSALGLARHLMKEGLLTIAD
jgi:ribosomal protein L16 Arg81 hydroxylase